MTQLPFQQVKIIFEIVDSETKKQSAADNYKIRFTKMKSQVDQMLDIGYTFRQPDSQNKLFALG
jgi:galactokinase